MPNKPDYVQTLTTFYELIKTNFPAGFQKKELDYIVKAEAPDLLKTTSTIKSYLTDLTRNGLVRRVGTWYYVRIVNDKELKEITDHPTDKPFMNCLRQSRAERSETL